jgi:hypothetical protein
MNYTELAGWNVHVEKRTIQQQGDNGAPVDVEGWALVFTEMAPPTGNKIQYAFGREVRDFIVRGLTGGIVLHGGELPKLPPSI